MLQITKPFILLILLILLFRCQPSLIQKTNTLLKDVTIITPYQPLSVKTDQYILYNKDSIIQTGPTTSLPSKINFNKTVEGKGRYVMAGLIDGFGTINNQSYADIYLNNGVTSIIGVESERRGEFFSKGIPTPTIYKLEGVGFNKISNKKLLFQIDSLHDIGIKVLLLMYKLTPDQIKLALDRAKAKNMATIGELGYTTYKEGMDLGIDAFVHNTRYSLDIAPRTLANAVAKEPFSSDPNSPKWQYYRYLTNTSSQDSLLSIHAKHLGQSNSFIMPTLSLCYLDWSKSQNPWNNKSAHLIAPKDIHRPADKTTGKHTEELTYTQPYTDLIKNQLAVIEKKYYESKAKYLVGSGADVWGTMPGISVHTEMALLNEVGLSNKEVLCAATSHFNDCFGWNIGKIETGFTSDFILMEQNPLDSLENLQTITDVILNGQIIQLK